MFALFSASCHGAKGMDVFGVGLRVRFGNKELIMRQQASLQSEEELSKGLPQERESTPASGGSKQRPCFPR